jgi:hypothetical protein
MNISEILAAIDKELTVLQSARAAIAKLDEAVSNAPVRRGPGRPPKNTLAVAVPRKTAKRKISDAGRASIAAAQKARWAARKAIENAPSASGKPAAKKSVKTASKKSTKKSATKAAKKTTSK